MSEASQSFEIEPPAVQRSPPPLTKELSFLTSEERKENGDGGRVPTESPKKPSKPERRPREKSFLKEEDLINSKFMMGEIAPQATGDDGGEVKKSPWNPLEALRPQSSQGSRRGSRATTPAEGAGRESSSRRPSSGQRAKVLSGPGLHQKKQFPETPQQFDKAGSPEKDSNKELSPDEVVEDALKFFAPSNPDLAVEMAKEYFAPPDPELECERTLKFFAKHLEHPDGEGAPEQGSSEQPRPIVTAWVGGGADNQEVRVLGDQERGNIAVSSQPKSNKPQSAKPAKKKSFTDKLWEMVEGPDDDPTGLKVARQRQREKEGLDPEGFDNLNITSNPLAGDDVTGEQDTSTIPPISIDFPSEMGPDVRSESSASPGTYSSSPAGGPDTQWSELPGINNTGKMKKKSQQP